MGIHQQRRELHARSGASGDLSPSNVDGRCNATVIAQDAQVRVAEGNAAAETSGRGRGPLIDVGSGTKGGCASTLARCRDDNHIGEGSTGQATLKSVGAANQRVVGDEEVAEVDDDIRAQFKRSAAVGGRYVVDHLNVVEGDGTCVAQEKDGVLRCGVVGDQTVRDCRGDILEIEGSESAVAKVVVDHRLIEIDVVWTAIAHPEERLAKDVGLIGRDEHTTHGKVVGWSVN